MPRRRRKQADSMRPSLTFLESPVNVQHSPPSPVLCSDHPATAKVVPVEELPEWEWVSPQFENRGRFTGLRSRRGRRRHTDAGHNGSIFTKSRLKHTAKSPSKFKTLDFEKGIQRPPSPVQHLHFNQTCDKLTVHISKDNNDKNTYSSTSNRDNGPTYNSPGPVTRSRSLPNEQLVDNHQEAVKCTDLNSSMPDSPYTDVHTPTASATPKRKPPYFFQHVFSSEFETPKNCKPSDAKILVYDTPEEDYGVPYRLRSKKYRKRLSKINKSF